MKKAYLILFIFFLECSQGKTSAIKVSSVDFKNGWYYIFICNNCKNTTPLENGYFYFRNNIIIPDSKLISEKITINLYKESKLYNDSALFFSSSSYSNDSKEIKNIEYYSFYIPVNGEKNKYGRTFKNEQHFKQQDFIEKTVIENGIK